VGASGYLGRRILDLLGKRGIGTFNSRPQQGLQHFDANTGSFEDFLRALDQPVSHVFVPYGAIDPERCAREPAATMQVNVVGVVRLLDMAMKADVTPVFFSTDYVFDGAKGGYRETDAAKPRTSYGAQKLAVEQWLGTVPKPWMIARMSKVVGTETDTHSVLGQWVNDIRAKKPQRAATDQVLSPAWVDDIARALIELCDNGETGLWHVAGAEAVSRYDLLAMLLEEVRKVDPPQGLDMAPCSLHDLPFAEKRPLNTSLDVGKLNAALGWRFRTMRELCAETARLHFGK
jgi:dTDP-4-dehydrorhamnose reductase